MTYSKPEEMNILNEESSQIVPLATKEVLNQKVIVCSELFGEITRSLICMNCFDSEIRSNRFCLTLAPLLSTASKRRKPLAELATLDPNTVSLENVYISCSGQPESGAQVEEDVQDIFIK